MSDTISPVVAIHAALTGTAGCSASSLLALGLTFVVLVGSLFDPALMPALRVVTFLLFAVVKRVVQFIIDRILEVIILGWLLVGALVAGVVPMSFLHGSVQ